MPFRISWRCPEEEHQYSPVSLKEQLKPGLKRPKLKPKNSKTFQHIQIMRRKKHPQILKKPHIRPKKPKILLKKLNILLKKQRSYYWKPKKYWEEAIVKLIFEAGKAKAIPKKHKEATKKVNKKNSLNYQITRSSNLKLNLEISWDELDCEHCHDEFEDQNCIMITSTLVQQNHIQYDHQELYYDNSEKYIAHNCQVWKTMKKHVLNVKSFIRTSKLKLKLRILRKEI